MIWGNLFFRSQIVTSRYCPVKRYHYYVHLPSYRYGTLLLRGARPNCWYDVQAAPQGTAAKLNDKEENEWRNKYGTSS